MLGVCGTSSVAICSGASRRVGAPRACIAKLLFCMGNAVIPIQLSGVGFMWGRGVAGDLLGGIQSKPPPPKLRDIYQLEHLLFSSFPEQEDDKYATVSPTRDLGRRRCARLTVTMRVDHGNRRRTQWIRRVAACRDNGCEGRRIAGARWAKCQGYRTPKGSLWQDSPYR